MTTAALPEILKVAEAARFLRVSKYTIYAEIAAGRLRAIRMASRVLRLSRLELERWMAEQ